VGLSVKRKLARGKFITARNKFPNATVTATNSTRIPHAWKKKVSFSAACRPTGKFVEMIELPTEVHPYFVGCQFHPEYKSKPLTAHPIFVSFVKAALQNRLNSENLKGRRFERPKNRNARTRAMIAKNEYKIKNRFVAFAAIAGNRHQIVSARITRICGNRKASNGI
jgi:hypothetical protein